MYTKTINGQPVFSECRTIITTDGRWVTNPSAAQITAAGWTEYTEPEEEKLTPDMEQVLDSIRKSNVIDYENLNEEKAEEIKAIYPSINSRIGTNVIAGERLWDDGELYKAKVNITALTRAMKLDPSILIGHMHSLDDPIPPVPDNPNLYTP